MADRSRFWLQAGAAIVSIVPGAFLLLLTGSWLYPAGFLVLIQAAALFRLHIVTVASYYALKPFAGLLGGGGFVPERMVIATDSSAARRRTGGIPPERILLLLPHCLQHHDCPHRITFDPANCRRCGRCPVGDLVEIAARTGVKLAVATGGTLARRHLREKKPLAVVAVACPRDLGQGMLDAWPIPVVGVENRRPCGDCVDTTVDTEAVLKAIKSLIS